MRDDEIIELIGKPESKTLEYKAVLPPSKAIARLISAFANTEGGHIIIGVAEEGGRVKVMGLSEDFHAVGITRKAVDSLTPTPLVEYGYVNHQNGKIFAIKVYKSENTISLQNQDYIRIGNTVKIVNQGEVQTLSLSNDKVSEINTYLKESVLNSSNSKTKLIEHYLSVLKIIDDSSNVLFPVDFSIATTNQEGKVLSKMLYASFVDNFETYLADLLYEIYLAKPETLKTKQTITIEEVLNCSDLQDVVIYVAKKKLEKLNKGSVKSFIAENMQIKELEIIDSIEQDKVEKILQIRHLYTHKNGIVDEKFLKYFPLAHLNTEYMLSIEIACEYLKYLTEIVNKLDAAAIIKYRLSTN